jgi:hypothetical protein
MTEETFGPTIAINRVKNMAEAILRSPMQVNMALVHRSGLNVAGKCYCISTSHRNGCC